MQTAYIKHPSEYKTTSASASSSSAATNKIIDYKRKNVAGLAPRFIFECAIKLNMKPLTSATAAIIFHRFFREVDSVEAYDEYVRTCMSFYFLSKNQIYFYPLILVNRLSIIIFGWQIEGRHHQNS